MSDILNNPNIKKAIWELESKRGIRARLADLLISHKSWETMATDERSVCVHHIVAQVESELELRRRLNDIGCIDCAIRWSETNPDDETDLEVQAIVKALGGLVAKSGALVMVMTDDDF